VGLLLEKTRSKLTILTGTISAFEEHTSAHPFVPSHRISAVKERPCITTLRSSCAQGADREEQSRGHPSQPEPRADSDDVFCGRCDFSATTTGGESDGRAFMMEEKMIRGLSTVLISGTFVFAFVNAAIAGGAPVWLGTDPQDRSLLSTWDKPAFAPRPNLNEVPRFW
jgi:hypothetical protein